MKDLKIKSVWRHKKSDALYVIETLTNLGSVQPERYPPTVVYRGTDGQLWSSPVSEWHDRMILTSSDTISEMCERKTADLEARGYVRTGYVLRQLNPGQGREVAVSEAGAVAWFTSEQWQWLMHGRDHVTFDWPKPIGHIDAKK